MEQPNYYSILTASVRYDKDLTPNAKLLYSEITALSNKKGICWASNSYFSDLYSVSKITISRWVSQLAKKGFITVKMQYIPNTKQVDKRIISLTPINKNDNTYKQNSLEGINKIVKEGIIKNVKDNTTSTNNTSINRDGKPSSISIVEDYFRLKSFDLSEAINFFEYYESNGWKVGRNAMKKWKLAANRWVRNAKPKKKGLSEEYFGDFMNNQNKLT
jgi:hypothetical protein|tara:strand:+ start:2373 stop:3023 length:651 start_codon:yes stop_codon:yes gene_type:complete